MHLRCVRLEQALFAKETLRAHLGSNMIPRQFNEHWFILLGLHGLNTFKCAQAVLDTLCATWLYNIYLEAQFRQSSATISRAKSCLMRYSCVPLRQNRDGQRHRWAGVLPFSLLPSGCAGHRHVGKVDGPGESNNTHLNQCHLFPTRQINLKRTPMLLDRCHVVPSYRFAVSCFWNSRDDYLDTTIMAHLWRCPESLTKGLRKA